MKKISTPLAICIIVVLTAIVVASILVYRYYLISQQPSVPTVVKTSTAITPTIIPKSKDETANWKTYRSEKYGLTFRYLATWILISSQNRGYFSSGSYPGLVLIIGEQQRIEKLPPQTLIQGNIEIKILENDCSRLERTREMMMSPYEEFIYYSSVQEKLTDGFKTAIGFIPKFSAYGAYICNSPESVCIQIISWESAEGQEKMNFFLNQFLPTIKIESKFNDIQCVPSAG